MHKKTKYKVMFERINNIETAFKHVRSFSICIVVVCAAVTGYAIYKSSLVMNQSQDRIYILYRGNVMEAVAGSRKDNISVEAAHHVEMLHNYFYTLSPDEKAIQATIGRALYLADKSAKNEYDNLRESGYYSNLIAGNISQQIRIDSVSIDLKQYPYYFVCRATQTFIRTSSIVERSLVTEGALREVARSENNPHGFLAERWTVLENNDLRMEKR